MTIEGEKINPLTDLNFTDITFDLTPLTSNGTGAIVFSEPLHLEVVEANFDNLFDVYIKNTTWNNLPSAPRNSHN